MIEMMCGNCGRKLRVKSELSDQKRKCPSCKTIVEIPTDKAVAQATNSSDVVHRFNEAIEKVSRCMADWKTNPLRDRDMMESGRSQIRRWQMQIQSGQNMPPPESEQLMERLIVEIEQHLSLWDKAETLNTNGTSANVQTSPPVKKLGLNLSLLEVLIALQLIPIGLGVGIAIFVELDTPVLGIVWIAAWLIGAGAYWHYREANRCPSCGKKWARVQTDATLLGQQSGTATVTRRDQIRDTDYKLVGYVDHDEQVDVKHESYLDHFECRFCKHYWFGTSNKTYEA